MGAYRYVAVDAAGAEHKGVLEGDTPRHVRQLLRERELLPVEVAAVERQDSSSRRRVGVIGRGIGTLDLALVTRQLATLIRAGLPLDEALLAVSEQTDKPRVKHVILGVRAKVLEGHALADGLEDFPQAFPNVYRATVSAGEQAGRLDAVLERLADYTESRHGLRQKISHALIYPIVLTTFSVGIVIFMLIYIVPKVVGVFETTGQTLPVLTRGLIALSEFLQDWWLALAVAVVAAGLIFRRALRSENARRHLHRWMLKAPVIGRVTLGLNTARFTRTLSILISSGVPTLEALRIGGSVVGNLPLREAVEEAAVHVREGAPIGRSLARSKLFPPMCIHLISSGEASGELDSMLERTALHQESEMDGLIGAMMGILQPALIVLMGALVLAIVMAILLPIFQINQLAI